MWSAAEGLVAMPPFDSSLISEDMIVHDAAMCAVLGAVAKELPGGFARRGEGADAEPVVLGQLAFGGGTSLSMCHGVTSRFSEDMDFVLVPSPGAVISQSTRKRISRRPIRIARSTLDATSTDYKSWGVRRTITSATVTYSIRALEIDVAWRDDFAAQPHLMEIRERSARSLLGRFGRDVSHLPPEALGPHPTPCVGVPYLAATKLDALHVRATQGDLIGIADRARDLYDLAMIAESEHADRARELVPELAEIVENDIRNRRRYPRPARGYAESAVFQWATPANDALREGFEGFRPLIYGQVPTFAQMVEAARSLDPS